MEPRRYRLPLVMETFSYAEVADPIHKFGSNGTAFPIRNKLSDLMDFE